MLVAKDHCNLKYVKTLAQFDGVLYDLSSKNKDYENMTAYEIAKAKNRSTIATALEKLGAKQEA